MRSMHGQHAGKCLPIQAQEMGQYLIETEEMSGTGGTSRTCGSLAPNQVLWPLSYTRNSMHSTTIGGKPHPPGAQTAEKKLHGCRRPR